MSRYVSIPCDFSILRPNTASVSNADVVDKHGFAARTKFLVDDKSSFHPEHRIGSGLCHRRVFISDCINNDCSRMPVTSCMGFRSLLLCAIDDFFLLLAESNWSGRMGEASRSRHHERSGLWHGYGLQLLLRLPAIDSTESRHHR